MRITSIILLVLPLPAYADSLDATRGQPLREVAHQVRLSAKHGVARFQVERTFLHTGSRHEQAQLTIALPRHAAATGLQIQAKHRRYRGDLLRAEPAAQKYRRLTGMGTALAKDPALLRWLRHDMLELRVFPVAPRKPSTTTYRLVAPTYYRRGRYYTYYPRPVLGPAVLTFPAKTRDPRVDGRAVAPSKPRVIGQSAASAPTSTIDVTTSRAFEAAEVSVELEHADIGDLRLELVSPGGTRYLLHNRKGRCTANLKKTIALKFEKRSPVRGRWRLYIDDMWERDMGLLHRWSLTFRRGGRTYNYRAADMPQPIADSPDHSVPSAVLSWAAPPIKTALARLGAVRLSHENHVFHLELDVAPKLSNLPARAWVVFVVDASRSVGERGLARQLALMRAYLAHLPDAHFEIVSFQRQAKRLLNRFAPATQIEATLRRLTRSGAFALGNGSDAGSGLLSAQRALQSRRGPRRIVLLTDTGTARGLFYGTRLARLKKRFSGTVLTAAVVARAKDKRLSFGRYTSDAGPLPQLAAATDGMAFTVTLPLGQPHRQGLKPKRPVALRAEALEMVRPLYIEDIAIEGRHEKLLPYLFLREGQGFRITKIVSAAPRRLVLTGKLWNKPWRKVVRASKVVSKAAAAFVFSKGLSGDLGAKDALRLARYAGVVSPMTSYLAVEPGVRPSKEGLAHGKGIALQAAKGMCPIPGPTILPGHGKSPDITPLVTKAVRGCQPGYKAGQLKRYLSIGLSYDEITGVSLAGPKDALARCITETIWRIRLPATYQAKNKGQGIKL